MNPNLEAYQELLKEHQELRGIQLISVTEDSANQTARVDYKMNSQHYAYQFKFDGSNQHFQQFNFEWISNLDREFCVSLEYVKKMQ